MPVEFLHIADVHLGYQQYGHPERFNDTQNPGANIQRLFMRRTGMFRSEPFILVGDVIRRETQTYEAVLKAIAAGRRTPQEIGAMLGLTSSYLSPYLKQLEALHLIERRLPATIPPERRRTSRNSLYHLADPYLRFYFRFIQPNLGLVEQELTSVLWQRIAEQFRAFVGLTAFEELCREWTLVQARAGRLPFPPEIVGSHFVPPPSNSPRTQGEDKKGWHVHYVFFARAGFTDAARAEAESLEASLVDLERLDTDLRRALEEA